MNKYTVLFKERGENMYMVTDGENVVAWFLEKKDAAEWVKFKNHGYVVVRRHEIDRIRENVDRMISKLDFVE